MGQRRVDPLCSSWVTWRCSQSSSHVLWRAGALIASYHAFSWKLFCVVILASWAICQLYINGYTKVSFQTLTFFLSLSFNLVHSLLLQLHNQIRDSSQAFEFALRTDITSPFKTWSERLKIADGTENCIKGTKISPRSHGNSPSAKGSGDRSTDHRGHPKGKCLCCLKCVRRVEDIWAVDCWGNNVKRNHSTFFLT